MWGSLRSLVTLSTQDALYHACGAGTRHFPNQAAGVGPWAEQTLQMERGRPRKKDLRSVVYNREDTGRREVEISFCVFACLLLFCSVSFYLVYLNFPAATLAYGYPSVLFWQLRNFGVCESSREEKVVRLSGPLEG